MVHLISAVICEEYQELLNGDTNYISCFDEVMGVGICNFDFVLSWYGEGEIVLERIIVVSPSEEVISATEQEIIVNETQTTLSEFEAEFKESGLHWILIYDNDKLVNKVPLIVLDGEWIRERQDSS